MSRRTLAWLVPALAAALLYAPMMGAGFLYDDLELIARNPRLLEWSFLADAFRAPMWELISPDRDVAAFYRPLGLWLLALPAHLFGPDPAAYHAIAVLLHAAVSAAVARLALRLGLQPLTALAVGLLFAVHGAHVEAVAWVSSMPDLLAALFAVLGLSSLVGGRLVAAAALLTAGMLTKESALAAWFAGVAWVLLARRDDDAPPRSRALLALALGLLVVWLLRVQAFGTPTAGLERQKTFHFLPFGEEAVFALSVLAHNLGYLFWPWPHEVFRPWRLDLTAASPQRWVPASLAVAAVLGAAAVGLGPARRRPPLFLGLATLFAALLMLLNVRVFGQFPYGERYLYLPAVGFVLVVGWALERLLKREGRVLALGIVLAAPNVLSVRAVLPEWRDEETFYRWAISTSPETMTPYLGLGRVLLERAQATTDPAERVRLAEQALEVYQRSLSTDPDRVFITALEREMGNLGLGDALLLGGDPRAAREVYERIVEHYRGSANGELGLGNCAAALAQEAAGLNDSAGFRRWWAEALEHYEQALALDPTLTAAVSGKARALASLRRLTEALPLAERAYAVAPGPETLADLVAILAELGRFAAAREVLEAYLAEHPDDPRRDILEATLEWLRAAAATPGATLPPPDAPAPR